VLLLQGETIVTTALVEEAAGPSAGSQGVLTVTTYRVVYERRSGGLLTAARHTTIVDMPIADLSNAHVDRRLVGRPILRLEFPGASRQFKSDAADQIHGALVQTKQRVSVHRFQAPPPPPYAPHVVVNVQGAGAGTPPPPPPPGPEPMIMMRCSHCQRIYPMVQGRCPGCGAPA
jgi:hypothetical protein